MPCWIEPEKQEMFVRNIEIVKHPNGRVVPSVVRLYVAEDAIEQAFASGIYFNPMESVEDAFYSFPHREPGVARNFIGKVPANRAVPCEIQSASQVVNDISGDERQIEQGLFEIWELVYQRLCSSVWVMLDCGSVSVFLRDNSDLQFRDVLIGPINLQAGISKKCAHTREVIMCS